MERIDIAALGCDNKATVILCILCILAARQAYEHGYELLMVKDATTSSVAEGHDMSMKHILPRLGRLVQGGDLTFTRI
jgi:isochorismate hydrolase